MRQINLPKSNITVSKLCFGAASFGTEVKGDSVDRLIEDYVLAGGDFFDTAHCYACWVPGGAGASEKELGAALRRAGLVGKVKVATKGAHPAIDRIYPRPEDFLSQKALKSDIQESRDRLGLEVIDLYYLHRDDGKTPVSEIIESLNQEIASGSIDAIGASNWSCERIADANAYAEANGLKGFVLSQIQWSLAVPNWKIEPKDPTMRYATETVLEWCQANSMPIAAYSSTACGYFAGARGSASQFHNEINAQRLSRARSLAERRGFTPTQIALAFLLNQNLSAFPVFSTTDSLHLKEILGATEVRLTGRELLWLLNGSPMEASE